MVVAPIPTLMVEPVIVKPIPNKEAVTAAGWPFCIEATAARMPLIVMLTGIELGSGTT